MVAVAWLLVAVPEVIRMTKKKEEKNKKKDGGWRERSVTAMILSHRKCSTVCVHVHV